MSESSSDTESSCGWTIISNEGSDIETLGPDHGADSKPQLSEGPEGKEPQEEPQQEEEQEEVQQEPSVLQAEQHSEPWAESSLDSTLKVEEHEQAEGVSEDVAGRLTLCSSSEHSDIMTLEPSMVAEPRASWEEQQEVREEVLDLGSSSSSQYTFSATEITPSLPVEPSGRDSSSSSGEEEAREPGPALRRRRGRRSTASTCETEEAQGQQGPAVQEEQPEQKVQRTLNKCIFLALVIAVSMGFGHFYGTVQTQERQKLVDKMRGFEQCGGDVDLEQWERDVSKEVVQQLREDLEEKQATVLSLTQIMDKITKENHHLRLKQSQQQAQKIELSERLRQSAQEKTEMEFHHRHLATENQQLMSSLEREEQSLSALREELLGLHAQIQDLEGRGAGADSVLSENQKLKQLLEEEKQRIQLFLSQKEALGAEAQALRQELDRERKATGQLKDELEQLSMRGAAEAGPEMEELRGRLAELEKKLHFEQQRSDLWERLYVETKEVRAKGDQQPRAKKPKEGIIGKVKETFDAVKNSTKEFVHHHKEQIKKAKEAVKENLRKFSDSVKSTFHHFKDSASRVFEKARRPQDRKFHERKEATGRYEHQQDRSRQQKQEKDHRSSWKPRSHQPLHQHPRKSTADTFQADHNTRKPGPTGWKGSESARHRRRPKGCSGIFDCANQESMSLFNKALEPIRADEFNQLIHSYLQQEVDHFHHWRELDSFINSFFRNGVFIHDQMLFTDFVSGVEDYLEDMDEYQTYNDDVFEDLDDYVFKHFFGDSYSKQYGPSRPTAKPATKRKPDQQSRPCQQHRAHLRPQKQRKWSKPGRPTGRHMADVKIELGPMPFDPKY